MVTTLVAKLPEDLSVEDLGLTARELEVLEAIGEGRLPDREIAGALYIAPATAQTHVKRILRKAGLRNRRQEAEREETP